MRLQVNKDEVATQVRVAFRESEEAKISELTTHSSVVDVQYGGNATSAWRANALSISIQSQRRQTIIITCGAPLLLNRYQITGMNAKLVRSVIRRDENSI